MKIIFLCGSLEPGRDGVGDYVRGLACQIIRSGNEAMAVSLNDHYITEVQITSQPLNNCCLPVLRLPSLWTEKSRFASAEKWIRNSAPDWISLQYVPHSFQCKGLPFSFLSFLEKLVKGKKLHIMFHETWVSGYKLNSLVISQLQKYLVKQMFSSLKPILVHASLPLNTTRLQKKELEIKCLPIFSNIEIAKKSKKYNKETFRIGFFSQIDDSKSIVNFLNKIAVQARLIGLQVELLLIGCSESQKRKLFKKILHSQIRVVFTGFLDPVPLSHILQTCDLGITPVPRHALGKSGSVAAFLSHGIPVAAPNVNSNYKPTDVGFFSPNLASSILLEPDIDLVKRKREITRIARKEILISVVAKTFLSDLVDWEIS